MKAQLKTKRRLHTIWHIPDDLWSELQPLLPPEKPPVLQDDLSCPSGILSGIASPSLRSLLHLTHAGQRAGDSPFIVNSQGTS